MVCMWMPENKLQEEVLSFFLVGPKDRTQVYRLSGKGLYLLSPSPALFLETESHVAHGGP